MSAGDVFSILNLIAMAGWVALVVLPRARWVPHVAGVALPVLFAIVYVGIAIVFLPGARGGFGSLADVATLFANPWLLLAGWTHYLAFDLLVGNWEAQDAKRRGVPHWLLVPCLVLTFLLGPAGWLLYNTVRSRWGNDKIDDQADADRHSQRAHGVAH